MSQSNKINFKVFCEKLPFDSLFFSESQVFPVGFLCVLKMFYVSHFIVEKMGFGMNPKRSGIYSKPQALLQKIYLSYAFETLVVYAGIYLCTHALARVRKSQPTYIGQGLLWSFYFQKQIFAQLKGYIFHFNSP